MKINHTHQLHRQNRVFSFGHHPGFSIGEGLQIERNQLKLPKIELPQSIQELKLRKTFIVESRRLRRWTIDSFFNWEVPLFYVRSFIFYTELYNAQSSRPQTTDRNLTLIWHKNLCHFCVIFANFDTVFDNMTLWHPSDTILTLFWRKLWSSERCHDWPDFDDRWSCVKPESKLCQTCVKMSLCQSGSILTQKVCQLTQIFEMGSIIEFFPTILSSLQTIFVTDTWFFWIDFSSVTVLMYVIMYLKRTLNSFSTLFFHHKWAPFSYPTSP